ncbi:MAG: PHB depolymerase family esterase [Solirubrobacteraceae bacterium]
MKTKLNFYSLLFLIVLCFSMNSCSNDFLENPTTKTKDSIILKATKELKLKMRVNLLNRDYLVILPGSHSADSNTKYPVVFGFHGVGNNYTQMKRYLEAKANEKNYILILPNGTAGVSNVIGMSFRGWNAGDCCGPAEYRDAKDVEFISQLIKEVVEKYNGDEKRIYLTGFSNGAMMCYRAACELSDKIAAIAPVSGSMNTGSCNDKTRPVPLLQIHSTNDNIVPYNGGFSIASFFGSLKLTKLTFRSVIYGLEKWAMINGCDRDVTVTEKEGYSILEWKNCKNNIATTIHYRLNNGAHTWPGSIREVGKTEPSNVINATDMIFDFFDGKKLN